MVLGVGAIVVGAVITSIALAWWLREICRFRGVRRALTQAEGMLQARAEVQRYRTRLLVATVATELCVVLHVIVLVVALSGARGLLSQEDLEIWWVRSIVGLLEGFG